MSGSLFEDSRPPQAARLAPALRSRNPERREGGIQQLETLAELAQELSQLLFWRDLRDLAGR